MKIHPIGHQALVHFGRAAAWTLCPFLLTIIPVFHLILSYTWLHVIFVIGCFIQYYLYSKRRQKSPHYQFNWRSALLGNIFASGFIWIIYAREECVNFGYYMLIMAIFHFTEFITTALINPRSLKIDSFLLNHSQEYGIAATISWMEYLIECNLFPLIKTMKIIRNLGLIICIIGEIIRKSAMFTAGSNFNHIIQTRREENHRLIKHGVYNLCRHPSYVGWYYWAIGTQLILANPVCLIGYAFVSWSFFKARIEEEEVTLVEFFGQEYLRYKDRVPCGLPFIHGYDPRTETAEEATEQIDWPHEEEPDEEHK